MGNYAHAQDLHYYEEVLFQDVPALFTSLRVKSASIPPGMYRYEIREEGGELCQLSKGILVNHYGTLLTADPIQLMADGYLSCTPGDLVFLSEGVTTLDDFQCKHPPLGRDVMELFVANPEEGPLFFTRSAEQDAADGCIGHMRGDFERDILYHTWWPHCLDGRYNNADFKADLTRVVDWLRTGFAPLKNLETMAAFCAHYDQAALPDEDRAYGFRVETRRYRYMLRCTPVKGAYHVYLYCYSKEALVG